MTTSALIISQNESDLAFWSSVAEANSLTVRKETTEERIREYLIENPSSIVVWDAESDEAKALAETLVAHANSARVFAVTEDMIDQDPNLFCPPAFGHHVFRRYNEQAKALCTLIVGRLQQTDPFGILSDIAGAPVARWGMTLGHSHEKGPALDALIDFLGDSGVIPKLSRLAADAADELIMNGLFDAPWDQERGFYRRRLDRAAGFELLPHEKLEIQSIVSDEMIGIKVVDQFGSLDRTKILQCLCKNLRGGEYKPPTEDPGAGLGIYKINQSAMTLVFASKPGVRTEVMVLFANAKSYREFRLGFCCFSVIAC